MHNGDRRRPVDDVVDVYGPVSHAAPRYNLEKHRAASLAEARYHYVHCQEN